mmetsp:Transcript_4896/g.13320  ORF Transcript_4896/g.13320 Transcript_4896/m.13320 type:complete len:101 (+) Transcript_4896:69-371(+)
MGASSSVAHEAGVSNHAGHRAISDRLDSALWPGGYQSTSGSRAMVHGVYHLHVAEQKERAGNAEGAAAERARAAQQAAVYKASTFKKAVDAMQEMEKWGR